MIDRRRLVVAGVAAALTPMPGFAQPATKVARIGFLIPASASSYASRVEALRAGLRDLGYVEGRNLLIEFRVADGKYDRLVDLATELVRLEVEVIVTGGTPGTRAAKQATATIPIVMAVSGDAVATGLIASLARPGGNITGTTYFDPELHAKRLELLKATVPRATRIGTLINPDNPQTMASTLPALRRAAESMKVELFLFEARSPSEFEGAISAMTKERVEAVEIADDPMFLGNLRAIADIVASRRLPSTGAKEFAEAGGLLGYGVNFAETFRRAAYFVDKLLKGAKPNDLPVEQATKFELVINLKTAQTLGLTIPQSLLLRADEVIR